MESGLLAPVLIRNFLFGSLNSSIGGTPARFSSEGAGEQWNGSLHHHCAASHDEFGLGILSKVVFGVTLVFFIVFFNTFQGVREVDRNILNNARMLGASERDLVRHILLPSALTWILASLHTSVGLALVGAVVGEYLGSARGLGYIINQAEGLLDTTGVIAGIVVLSVFVLLVDVVVTLIEQKLLVWKPGTQVEAR